jgi:hypothetical protein
MEPTGARHAWAVSLNVFDSAIKAGSTDRI